MAGKTSLFFEKHTESLPVRIDHKTFYLQRHNFNWMEKDAVLQCCCFVKSQKRNKSFRFMQKGFVVQRIGWTSTVHCLASTDVAAAAATTTGAAMVTFWASALVLVLIAGLKCIEVTVAWKHGCHRDVCRGLPEKIIIKEIILPLRKFHPINCVSVMCCCMFARTTVLQLDA